MTTVSEEGPHAQLCSAQDAARDDVPDETEWDVDIKVELESPLGEREELDHA